MLTGLKIVIAGGTGFIGRAMAERWNEKNDVIIFTRQLKAAANNSYGSRQQVKGVKYVQWDAKTVGNWKAELEGADILINLAGRSVNCRYNEANKAEIINSRTEATQTLGLAVLGLKNPPALWINGASATIYRHAEDKPQDEYTGEMHNDFSVQVCKAWEQSFNELRLPATRKAILRMAIVLGQGGVLVPYTRLAKFGLGGKQGSGRQMFSWIHIEDLCRIVEWLYENREQNGTFNASAPTPVPNKILMQEIRKAVHAPVGLPAPAWLLKIGAAVIGTETELLLKSR